MLFGSRISFVGPVLPLAKVVHLKLLKVFTVRFRDLKCPTVFFEAFRTCQCISAWWDAWHWLPESQAFQGHEVVDAPHGPLLNRTFLRLPLRHCCLFLIWALTLTLELSPLIRQRFPVPARLPTSKHCYIGRWLWFVACFSMCCNLSFFVSLLLIRPNILLHIIANNLPANDAHWDSDDPGWVGKASMSNLHWFLIRRNLRWRWFNALIFHLELKGFKKTAFGWWKLIVEKVPYGGWICTQLPEPHRSCMTTLDAFPGADSC